MTIRELPVATTLAGVNMRLKAGAYRELHWHKEDKWAFMLAGSVRTSHSSCPECYPDLART